MFYRKDSFAKPLPVNTLLLNTNFQEVSNSASSDVPVPLEGGMAESAMNPPESFEYRTLGSIIQCINYQVILLAWLPDDLMLRKNIFFILFDIRSYGLYFTCHYFSPNESSKTIMKNSFY